MFQLVRQGAQVNCSALIEPHSWQPVLFSQSLALMITGPTDLDGNWHRQSARRSEDPDHAKALYRRGTTHAILGDYEDAERDLAHAKRADPSTAADIDRELAKMRQRQRAAASKERREFRNFFDRTK